MCDAMITATLSKNQNHDHSNGNYTLDRMDISHSRTQEKTQIEAVGGIETNRYNTQELLLRIPAVDSEIYPRELVTVREGIPISLISFITASAIVSPLITASKV